MYEEIVKTAVAPTPVPIPTPAPVPTPAPAPLQVPVISSPLVTHPTVQPAVAPPSYVNRKNFIPTVSDLVNTRKSIGGSKVDAPIYRFRH